MSITLKWEGEFCHKPKLREPLERTDVAKKLVLLKKRGPDAVEHVPVDEDVDVDEVKRREAGWGPL